MAPPDVLPDTLLARLESALIKEFRSARRTLEKRDSVGGLFPEPADGAAPAAHAGKPNPVLYVVRPRLRLVRHFDPEPDMLILDEDLGTLGLVHILPSADKPEEIFQKVRTCVDHATYARHLLLMDTGLEECLPRSVELVLVFGNQALEPVASALRDVARETSCLKAIGVNTLSPLGEGEGEEEDAGFSSSDVCRAFPWLLLKTHRWYQLQSRVAKGSKQERRSPARPLRSLTLENYRLPGRRKLELLDSVRLHLIHGYNGSGKSSLVESLELVLTGASERLSKVAGVRYDHVIRNRGSEGPARVTLEYGKRRVRKSFVVNESGLDSTLGKLIATSFRLDQTVMDRIARGNDAQRAEILLGAFFPKDAGLYRALHEKREEARRVFEQLPEELRREIPPPMEKELPEDPVLERFKALDPALPETAAGRDDCLPVPLDVLEALAPLASGLEDEVRAWKKRQPRLKDLPQSLERIDGALGRIQPGEALRTIRLAKEALQRLAGWYATGTAPPAKDRERALNEWLELCALSDLADKHLQMARTLREAQEAGWKLERPEGETAAGPFAQAPPLPDEIETLRRQAAGWATQRDQRLGELDTLPKGGGRRGKGPSAPPRAPSPDHIRALDQAGPWLLLPGHEAPEKSLGQLVVQAIARGVQTFGDIHIGTRGWAEPAIQRLTRLEGACGQLLQERVARPDWTAGVRRLQILQEVLAKHRAARSAALDAGTTFFTRIQGGDGSDPGLYDALNELMALFTPARWAYEDIRFVHESQGGDSQIRMCTGLEQARAELRLNTAELNLLTFALFLLCAVQVDNPLRLLVLDDPLQNMDELTVTTLARGVTKVLRLLPEPWQLLVLFHGEEDLERFRREVPSAVYSLPWLTPTRSVAEVLILTEPGKRNAFQELRGLLAERPQFESETST